MPKREDYGHPYVSLIFSHQHQELLVEVVDDTTGDVLQREPLRATATWLRDSGYQWIPGSNGRWVMK
jgi:hypothetical protein